MAKKKNKKLSWRQKVINRVARRLKTKKDKGEYLKFTSKKAVETVIKSAGLRITKENANEIADSLVSSAEYISRKQAKDIKKKLGLSKISDVQKLKGKDLSDLIADIYEANGADAKKEILEAYGY